MKQFVDELINRLSKYEYSHLVEHESEECLHCKENEDDWCDCRDCLLCVMDSAKKIIKEVAEEYKPKTNADHIRAMSDKELAEYFSELIKDTQEYEYCVDVEDWLKWMQTETKLE